MFLLRTTRISKSLILYNHLSVNLVGACYFFTLSFFPVQTGLWTLLSISRKSRVAVRFSAEYKRDDGGLVSLK